MAVLNIRRRACWEIFLRLADEEMSWRSPYDIVVCFREPTPWLPFYDTT